MWSLFGLFSKDLAVDLGTTNTRVFMKGVGIVLNEPSIIALNSDTNKLIKVGKEAKEMEGKTPPNIEVKKPLRNGVIADFEAAEKMLRYFITSVHKRKFLLSPRVIIAVPSGITQVERKAVIESAQLAGAGDVKLVAKAMAAAIGAGLPIEQPAGNMIVDIGGGRTEVAVISVEGIVFCKYSHIGGEYMDNEIVDYIRKKYNLIIGEQTAENIKIKIGSATMLPEELSFETCGIDMVDRKPKTIFVTSMEIREALQNSLNGIIDLINSAIAETPPELISDIIDRGIFLVGGGSLLSQLDMKLREEINLPMTIADNPLDCVVLGAGKLLSNNELLKKVAI